MKLVLFVLFTAFMQNAEASEIRIKKMTKEADLERSYILKTNLPNVVVLDCQSFIQGLRIGEFEEAFTYLLDQEECENLSSRIRGSLRKFQNHCIDVEDDIRADYSCQ